MLVGTGVFLAIDRSYQVLQAQYRGVKTSVAVSHFILALNDFLRSGLSALISMLGSPNRTSLTAFPFFASTANFFEPFGVRRDI
jgi:hypothetical protein